MSTKNEETKKPEDGIEFSRREFLKSAGFVVGGATIGSMAILSACGGGSGATSTSTTTKTETTTVTGAGTTVTTTVGAGSTVTVTQPGVTVTQPGEGGTAPEGLVHLIVNDVDYWGVVQPEWTLAYVLREKLALTGTKRGCKEGACGFCTVIMEGRAVLSCCQLAIECDGKHIETVEGLADNGQLSALQQAFIDYDAMQCGFCTPGMLMTAKALLTYKPNPTDEEIKEYMAGTLCRCGSYIQILEAIQSQRTG